MKTFIFLVCITASNHLYQFINSGDYSAALERSYFGVLAVLVYVPYMKLMRGDHNG